MRPFIIGLSGGIASGKTAVSDYFAQLGIPIIDADIISRELLSQSILENPNSALMAVKDYFGNEVFDRQGYLNRPKLREIVFADEQKKMALEAIIHPRVYQAILEQAKSYQSAYIIISIPLLVESSSLELFDRIAIVDVTQEIQMKRCQQRDGSSLETIKNIINTQAPREERLKIADDIINNSGSLESLYPQLDKLHESYLNLASNKCSTSE